MRWARRARSAARCGRAAPTFELEAREAKYVLVSDVECSFRPFFHNTYGGRFLIFISAIWLVSKRDYLCMCQMIKSKGRQQVRHDIAARSDLLGLVRVLYELLLAWQVKGPYQKRHKCQDVIRPYLSIVYTYTCRC